jgi:predicted nucleotidyltransferase
MPSTVQRLAEKGLIRPPRFLPANTHYETLMGSVAYGVSGEASDVDVYGFAIPPKDEVFPHLAGEIPGFGRPRPRFEQFQEHHIHAPDEQAGHGRTYDLTIFNVVKYFNLALENNPNIIDSLFTPETCVLHITRVGGLVRESRRLFLHKGCWPKFKGYAYSQLHKMATKEPTGKRKEQRDKYGLDVKYAYHVVRLLYEAEQILMEGDLDLQRPREHLKAIRRGEVPEAEIRRWAADKERQLEQVYVDSKLRPLPDEEAVKALLVQCLEEHYGSLEKAVVRPDAAVAALRQIQEVLDRNRGLLGG